MRLPTFLSSRVRRLPIGIQLALAFTLVLSLTAALGGFSVLSLVQLNNASHELALKGLPSAKHLNAARAAALEMREFEMKHAAATDASYRAEYEEKLTGAQAVLAKNVQGYTALVQRDDEKKLLAAFHVKWKEYYVTQKSVDSLKKRQSVTTPLWITSLSRPMGHLYHKKPAVATGFGG
jgi:methyl-accepting chemotaxis protein